MCCIPYSWLTIDEDSWVRAGYSQFLGLWSSLYLSVWSAINLSWSWLCRFKKQALPFLDGGLLFWDNGNLSARQRCWCPSSSQFLADLCPRCPFGEAQVRHTWKCFTAAVWSSSFTFWKCVHTADTLTVFCQDSSGKLLLWHSWCKTATINLAVLCDKSNKSLTQTVF